MNLTEKDITSEVARSIRQGLGLTQSAFWEPLGVRQSTGHHYETKVKIPRYVRILLVARYVCSLAIDTSTPEEVAELKELGRIQLDRRLASGESTKARQQLEKATQYIESAKAMLAKV